MLYITNKGLRLYYLNTGKSTRERQVIQQKRTKGFSRCFKRGIKNESSKHINREAYFHVKRKLIYTIDSMIFFRTWYSKHLVNLSWNILADESRARVDGMAIGF